jgi:pimeloyl-ACP methyl ester carboxylesterase
MAKTAHQAIARDGTKLHWTSTGDGAPAILLTDGIGCAGFVWRHLEPALARRHRVLHWNYRGHGKSGSPREGYRVTVDDCAEDLLAVLDAAGEERAVLVGHSMGVQVVLEAHRRAPERVLALVLVCGAPGRPIDTFHDSPALKLAFPFARSAVEKHPLLARVVFKSVIPTDFAVEFALNFEVDGARVDRADLVRYFEDLAAVDPLLFVRMLASAGDHDTVDHLPHVDAPTLIVAGERDSFTPMRLSGAMHRAIPGSELYVVAGGSHVTPLEHPEAVVERVESFLTSALAPRASSTRARPAGERADKRRRPTARRPARKAR